MKVVPYEPWHLQLLALQDSQKMMQPLLENEQYRIHLKTLGPAFSAVVDDEIIASLGIAPQWEHRAIAWGLIGDKARQHFVPLTRAIQRFLDIAPYRRIETAVATNFREGHRWARLMGFVNEGTMHAYTPNGDDCDLYARVK